MAHRCQSGSRVSGTAPLGPDGQTVGRGDPAAQMRRCLEFLATALEKAGARIDDVVRTRILLTRIDDWEAVTRVHGEVFGAIRPANTVMQVTRFIDPEWLVEIEADAVVTNAPNRGLWSPKQRAMRRSVTLSSGTRQSVVRLDPFDLSVRVCFAGVIAPPAPPASAAAPRSRSSARSRPRR